MKHTLIKTLNCVAAAALVFASPIANAAKNSGTGNTVTYTGQGLNSNPDGFGGYDLNLEICGVANGADADGPYLLWVFTASGATSATITGPWGTAPMTKTSNGSFKFISGWFDPNTLMASPPSATATGKVKNAQLVVSHGCRPYTHGAWCSPGFWRNVQSAGWALVGKTPGDLFNQTVYDAWYGASFPADPTLSTVLNTPQTYSGAPVPGTLGYSLNAFNATGAYLTNNIPGYSFSWDAMQLNNDSQTCPIDHHGNWKTPS